MQAAVRYEDYSDFGAETVYKVAAKYDLTDSFGVAVHSTLALGHPLLANRAPLTYRHASRQVFQWQAACSPLLQR